MAAGDDSSVPLASPTGNADTRLTANGDHRQVVTVGNAGDAVANLDVPSGALLVAEAPGTLFVDPWAGSALDVTNRWTLAVGSTPTIASGTMTMSATLSSYNAIQSQGVMPYNLGYLYFATAIQIEASAAVGAGRFWGFGTYTASPSATKLATDGIGFEINQADGALLAVTYAAGVRTTVATLTRPTDGLQHRYAVYFRPTAAYWFIDGLQIAAASVTWPNVAIQELPVLIVRQNASSFTGTPVFANSSIAVGDTSRASNQLSDGTYGWRKASVSAQGALATGGISAGTVSGGIAASATGTVGPLDVSRAGNVSFIVKLTFSASPYTNNPVVVFEQSDDATSWSPLLVVRNDNGAMATTHVLPPGVANTSWIYEAALEGVNYVRARVTTAPLTNGITIVISTGTMPFSPGVTAQVNPVSSVPVGTTTGTTPALTGQVGRAVRANANVAQATAATLIAAPAAGTRIYVTGIVCSNEGATATVLRLFAGSLPAAAGAVAVVNDVFDFPMAASGGGAVVNFPPGAPWALPLATALSFAVTVATTWTVTVTYYVAP